MTKFTISTINHRGEHSIVNNIQQQEKKNCVACVYVDPSKSNTCIYIHFSKSIAVK